jgi:hypothetical protein
VHIPVDRALFPAGRDNYSSLIVNFVSWNDVHDAVPGIDCRENAMGATA